MSGYRREDSTDAFKYKVVLESFQRDTTMKQVQQKYNVPQVVLSRWRSYFSKMAPSVFSLKPNKKAKTRPQEDPEELKRIIGQLTIENEILKKALHTVS